MTRWNLFQRSSEADDVVDLQADYQELLASGANTGHTVGALRRLNPFRRAPAAAPVARSWFGGDVIVVEDEETRGARLRAFVQAQLQTVVAFLAACLTYAAQLRAAAGEHLLEKLGKVAQCVSCLLEMRACWGKLCALVHDLLPAARQRMEDGFVMVRDATKPKPQPRSICPRANRPSRRAAVMAKADDVIAFVKQVVARAVVQLKKAVKAAYTCSRRVQIVVAVAVTSVLAVVVLPCLCASDSFHYPSTEPVLRVGGLSQSMEMTPFDMFQGKCTIPVNESNGAAQNESVETEEDLLLTCPRNATKKATLREIMDAALDRMALAQTKFATTNFNFAPKNVFAAPAPKNMFPKFQSGSNLFWTPYTPRSVKLNVTRTEAMQKYLAKLDTQLRSVAKMDVEKNLRWNVPRAPAFYAPAALSGLQDALNSIRKTNFAAARSKAAAAVPSVVASPVFAAPLQKRFAPLQFDKLPRRALNFTAVSKERLDKLFASSLGSKKPQAPVWQFNTRWSAMKNGSPFPLKKPAFGPVGKTASFEVPKFRAPFSFHSLPRNLWSAPPVARAEAFAPKFRAPKPLNFPELSKPLKQLTKPLVFEPEMQFPKIRAPLSRYSLPKLYNTLDAKKDVAPQMMPQKFGPVTKPPTAQGFYKAPAAPKMEFNMPLPTPPQFTLPKRVAPEFTLPKEFSGFKPLAVRKPLTPAPTTRGYFFTPAPLTKGYLTAAQKAAAEKPASKKSVLQKAVDDKLLSMMLATSGRKPIVRDVKADMDQLFSRKFDLESLRKSAFVGRKNMYSASTLAGSLERKFRFSEALKAPTPFRLAYPAVPKPFSSSLTKTLDQLKSNVTFASYLRLPERRPAVMSLNATQAAFRSFLRTQQMQRRFGLASPTALVPVQRQSNLQSAVVRFPMWNHFAFSNDTPKRSLERARAYAYAVKLKARMEANAEARMANIPTPFGQFKYEPLAVAPTKSDAPVVPARNLTAAREAYMELMLRTRNM